MRRRTELHLWLLAAALPVLTTTGARASDNPELGIPEPNVPYTPPDDSPDCSGVTCDSCKVTNSPVALGSGQLFQAFHDLSFRTRGLPFDISRTYHSCDYYVGFFGRATHSSLDMMSIPTFKGNLANEVVIIRWPDGRRSIFTRQPDQTYAPSIGRYENLTEQASGYELRTTDGIVYVFDFQTRLLSITNRNGHQITLSYDATGRPTTVVLPDNRQITVTYNANGFVQSVSDFAGRTISYGYDSDGYLTNFTDAESHTWTYQYTGGKLSQILDPLGRATLTVTYDAQGRASRLVDEEGDHTYTYNFGNTFKKDNSLSGNQGTTYFFDTQGVITAKRDVFGKDIVYQYNALYQLTRVTDRNNNVTNYTYDSKGNMLSVTNPLNKTTTYTYNALNLVELATNPLGIRTKYEYDAQGSLTRVIEAFGDPLQRETSFTHDGEGALLAVTRPDGSGISYEYDVDGNLIASTDSLANRTIYTYDILGNRLSMTDPLGNITRYTYDRLGSLLTTTDPLGGVTQRSYDAAGHLTTITDADAKATAYVYDQHNRLLSVTDPMSHQTQAQYDAARRRTNSIDANGKQTSYVYDAGGRMTRETNALNYSTNYGYDNNNNRTSLTDANNNTTNFTYDSMNRLTRTTYPGGTFEEAGYDVAGRIATKKDRMGRTTSYTYDSLSRVTRKTYPDSTTVVFSYDAVDNMLTAVNAAAAMAFTYDTEGHLLSEANTTWSKTVSYTYNGAGRMSSITYPEGQKVTYHYDAAGRLAKMNDSSIMISADLDADGDADRDDLMILESCDSGPVVPHNGSPTCTKADLDHDGDVDQDDFGLWQVAITSPTSRDPSSLVHYTYSPAGWRLSKRLANGTQTQYTYDDAAHLLGIDHRKTDGSTLLTITYTVDAVGNRLTMNNSDGLHSYAYDDIYQLTGATHPNPSDNPNESYTYDPVGNRLTSHLSAEYTYDNNNRLLADDTFNYIYDANGSQLQRTAKSGGAVTQYSYDADSRLIRVDLPDGHHSASSYDALGRRILLADDTVSSRYVYAEESIACEYDNSMMLISLYWNGTGIDDPLIIQRGGTAYCYHEDGLNSVVGITDATQSIVASYTYASFGSIVAQAGVFRNAYTFTGRENDATPTLHYYRARSYLPRLGRFLQADPIGYLSGANRYTYVANNPMNLIDPSGMYELGDHPFLNCCGPGKDCAPGGNMCGKGPKPGNHTDEACYRHDNCLNSIPGKPGYNSCDLRVLECHARLLYDWWIGEPLDISRVDNLYRLAGTPIFEFFIYRCVPQYLWPRPGSKPKPDPLPPTRMPPPFSPWGRPPFGPPMLF